jgi:hypothetical protein
MQSKVIRVYGDDTAIGQYSIDPGISYSLLCMSINEAVAIKALVRQLKDQVAAGKNTYLLTPTEIDNLETKLKQYVSYEPQN